MENQTAICVVLYRLLEIHKEVKNFTFAYLLPNAAVLWNSSSRKGMWFTWILLPQARSVEMNGSWNVFSANIYEPSVELFNKTTR